MLYINLEETRTSTRMRHLTGHVLLVFGAIALASAVHASCPNGGERVRPCGMCVEPGETEPNLQARQDACPNAYPLLPAPTRLYMDDCCRCRIGGPDPQLDPNWNMCFWNNATAVVNLSSPETTIVGSGCCEDRGATINATTIGVTELRVCITDTDTSPANADEAWIVSFGTDDESTDFAVQYFCPYDNSGVEIADKRWEWVTATELCRTYMISDLSAAYPLVTDDVPGSPTGTTATLAFAIKVQRVNMADAGGNAICESAHTDPPTTFDYEANPACVGSLVVHLLDSDTTVLVVEEPLYPECTLEVLDVEWDTCEPTATELEEAVITLIAKTTVCYSDDDASDASMYLGISAHEDDIWFHFDEPGFSATVAPVILEPSVPLGAICPHGMPNCVYHGHSDPHCHHHHHHHHHYEDDDHADGHHDNHHLNLDVRGGRHRPSPTPTPAPSPATATAPTPTPAPSPSPSPSPSPGECPVEYYPPPHHGDGNVVNRTITCERVPGGRTCCTQWWRVTIRTPTDFVSPDTVGAYVGMGIGHVSAPSCEAGVSVAGDAMCRRYMQIAAGTPGSNSIAITTDNLEAALELRAFSNSENTDLVTSETTQLLEHQSVWYSLWNVPPPAPATLAANVTLLNLYFTCSAAAEPRPRFYAYSSDPLIHAEGAYEHILNTDVRGVGGVGGVLLISAAPCAGVIYNGDTHIEMHAEWELSDATYEAPTARRMLGTNLRHTTTTQYRIFCGATNLVCRNSYGNHGQVLEPSRSVHTWVLVVVFVFVMMCFIVCICAYEETTYGVAKTGCSVCGGRGCKKCDRQPIKHSVDVTVTHTNKPPRLPPQPQPPKQAALHRPRIYCRAPECVYELARAGMDIEIDPNAQCGCEQYPVLPASPGRPTINEEQYPIHHHHHHHHSSR